MANIFKIVFLGIIGFAGLVYLTAPQERLNPKEIDIKKINLSSFPQYFDVIGNNNYVKKEDLLKKDSYLIIANHDALAVLNKLYMFTNKKIVISANISQTPWLIKKLAVGGKLEELYKDSKIKLINDESGSLVKKLGFNDITQNKYFVYKITKDKKIKKLFEGLVKENALEKGISKEEKEKALKLLLKKL